jgi:hypothetical protein
VRLSKFKLLHKSTIKYLNLCQSQLFELKRLSPSSLFNIYNKLKILFKSCPTKFREELSHKKMIFLNTLNKILRGKASKLRLKDTMASTSLIILFLQHKISTGDIFFQRTMRRQFFESKPKNGDNFYY